MGEGDGRGGAASVVRDGVGGGVIIWAEMNTDEHGWAKEMIEVARPASCGMVEQGQSSGQR